MRFYGIAIPHPFGESGDDSNSLLLCPFVYSVDTHFRFLGSAARLRQLRGGEFSRSRKLPGRQSLGSTRLHGASVAGGAWCAGGEGPRRVFLNPMPRSARRSSSVLYDSPFFPGADPFPQCNCGVYSGMIFLSRSFSSCGSEFSSARETFARMGFTSACGSGAQMKR